MIEVFDMQRIGRRVADLRKNHNMTQMELADRLGISFQAVSAWERGQTMPDIGKLSDLSEILETTIDALLGNERYAELVQAISEDASINRPAQADELKELAPILKPAQLAQAVKETKTREPLSELAGLFPFLSEEMLTELAWDCYNSGEIDGLTMLAPHLEEETLNEVTKKIISRDGIRTITPLLPFVDIQIIEDLLRRDK